MVVEMRWLGSYSAFSHLVSSRTKRTPQISYLPEQYPSSNLQHQLWKWHFSDPKVLILGSTLRDTPSRITPGWMKWLAKAFQISSLQSCACIKLKPVAHTGLSCQPLALMTYWTSEVLFYAHLPYNINV